MAIIATRIEVSADHQLASQINISLSMIITVLHAKGRGKISKKMRCSCEVSK